MNPRIVTTIDVVEAVYTGPKPRPHDGCAGFVVMVAEFANGSHHRQFTLPIVYRRRSTARRAAGLLAERMGGTLAAEPWA
jgi:hypothetical protein